ncbi:MAG: hypothetical protein B7Y37_08200 [Sphingobacteriia bacterium 28-36-52]|nr:MAG: hypothetical protein B7Y37_08200 [Sphingobacteriia bacterium 28-36-52]
MFTFLSIVFSFLSFKLKRSSFLNFFSLNFIIFSFVIDGLIFGLFKDQFEFGAVNIDLSLAYIWVSYLLSYLIFAIIIKKDKESEQLFIPKTFSDKLIIFFLIISTVATIINVKRAGNIEMLFLFPREWEMNFGRYPLINYMYFLHIVVAFISIVQFKIHKSKYYLFAFIIAILLSVFHGIKMSIAHAVLIPSFGFFILNDYKLNKFIYRISLFFISLILIFFMFVRGGDIDGFLGYITSGTVNSIYKIQKTEFLLNSPIGTIIPDVGSMAGWIFRRFTNSEFISNNPGVGFILNEKYNTFHPISDSYFTTLSFFIMPMFLALVINRVKSRKYITIPNLFVESFLLYACFMFFWSWIFWQIKILYLILVIYTSYQVYWKLLRRR